MGKKSVHDNVLELLPWYINESLGKKERELVQVHLSECAACREERDHLQAIGQMVSEDLEVLPDYRFSLKKLNARISEAERNRESTREAAVLGGLPGVYRRNLVPIAGVAAALVVAIMLVAGVQQGGAPDPAFRTLTTETTVATDGDVRRLELAFEEPIQAAAMRQALIETRSNLLSGPDSEGNYIVEVALPSDETPDAYLERIRAIDGVRVARYSE